MASVPYDVIDTEEARALAEPAVQQCYRVAPGPDFVLVVNPENSTRVVNYADRNSCVLWGDASSAAVLSPRIPGPWKITQTMLRGDPSDGLPGVPGIGEKTAAKLLVEFGSLDALEAAATTGAPSLKPRARASLLESADYLRAARTVVFVKNDAELVDEGDDRLPAAPADPAALAALGGEIPFTPLDAYWRAAALVAAAVAGPSTFADDGVAVKLTFMSTGAMKAIGYYAPHAYAFKITAFVGLVVTMPILGHATWHAYRAMIPPGDR